MGQLEDMQSFIRIVDAGGIGRASEQLGIAKSAISRRLQELEERLGVKLLNRTTRTYSLTEAGRHYYEQSLRIIDDVDELNASASDDSSTVQGTINLAAPLTFGLKHLSQAIDDFCQLHPEVNIKIDFSDRQIDLIEEGFDLSFRITSSLKDSTLIARKISPIRLVLCASPDYLEREGLPTTPEELKEHHFLLYNSPGRHIISLKNMEGHEFKIKAQHRISANNGDFLKDMAINGHGIILTPTFVSWQAITSGQLVQIMQDFELEKLNAYAIYPQTRYLSRRVRMLIEFMINYFGPKPYWDKELDKRD